MIISIVSGSDFGAQSINQQSIRKELAEVRDKVNSLVDMLDSSGLGQNEERRPVDNSECVLAVFPLHHDHCCPSSSKSDASAIVIKSPSAVKERGREAADLAMAQQSESAQCHNDTVVSKVTYSQQHSHIVTRSRTFIFVF